MSALAAGTLPRPYFFKAPSKYVLFFIVLSLAYSIPTSLFYSTRFSHAFTLFFLCALWLTRAFLFGSLCVVLYVVRQYLSGLDDDASGFLPFVTNQVIRHLTVLCCASEKEPSHRFCASRLPHVLSQEPPLTCDSTPEHACREDVSLGIPCSVPIVDLPSSSQQQFDAAMPSGTPPQRNCTIQSASTGTCSALAMPHREGSYELRSASSGYHGETSLHPSLNEALMRCSRSRSSSSSSTSEHEPSGSFLFAKENSRPDAETRETIIRYSSSCTSESPSTTGSLNETANVCIRPRAVYSPCCAAAHILKSSEPSVSPVDEVRKAQIHNVQGTGSPTCVSTTSVSKDRHNEDLGPSSPTWRLTRVVSVMAFTQQEHRAPEMLCRAHRTLYVLHEKQTRVSFTESLTRITRALLYRRLRPIYPLTLLAGVECRSIPRDDHTVWLCLMERTMWTLFNGYAGHPLHSASLAHDVVYVFELFTTSPPSQHPLMSTVYAQTCIEQVLKLYGECIVRSEDAHHDSQWTDTSTLAACLGHLVNMPSMASSDVVLQFIRRYLSVKFSLHNFQFDKTHPWISQLYYFFAETPTPPNQAFHEYCSLWNTVSTLYDATRQKNTNVTATMPTRVLYDAPTLGAQFTPFSSPKYQRKRTVQHNVHTTSPVALNNVDSDTVETTTHHHKVNGASVTWSPGSTTSTDLPLSITSFCTSTVTAMGSKETLPQYPRLEPASATLHNAEHPLEPTWSHVLNEWRDVVDYNAAKRVLDTVEDHLKDASQYPHLRPLLIDVLKLFVSHNAKEPVIRTMEVLEKTSLIDIGAYEIALVFFSRLSHLEDASRYMCAAMQYVIHQMEETSITDSPTTPHCLPSTERSVLKSPSLDLTCDGQPVGVTSLSPQSDTPMPTPSNLPQHIKHSIHRCLEVYIDFLVQLGYCKDAFYFIFIRLHFFQGFPALLSRLLCLILKRKPELYIIRHILNIFISFTPLSPEQATNNLAKGEHIVMTTEVFSTLVEIGIWCKDTSLLLELLERFKMEWHSLVQPDLQTWAILIKVLGVHKHIEECRWIFWHMTERQQLAPCEVTYGCFLDALINNNRMNEAVAHFEKLKKIGTVRLNTIMFSTIAKGYAQGRQLNNALKIHQEMKDLGVSINTVTYNTLVDACARVGAIDKAAILLEDMLSSNVEPDLITFSTIAKGYCVKGDIARALELLDAMQERGILPDGILYNSLLDGCVRLSRLDLCQEIWQRMQHAKIPPSNFTLTILIKMFGRAGDLHQAFFLVHELPKRYGFRINAHVYTCLMSACIANKKFSKAVDVFYCMKKDGVPADARTYETVLLGILRSGRFNEAVTVIRDAFKLDEAHSYNSVTVPTNKASNLTAHQKRSNHYNEKHPIASGTVTGLHMDPRNICSLWVAMQRAAQMTAEVRRTIRDLQKAYGSQVARFLPPEATSMMHKFSSKSLYPLTLRS